MVQKVSTLTIRTDLSNECFSYIHRDNNKKERKKEKADHTPTKANTDNLPIYKNLAKHWLEQEFTNPETGCLILYNSIPDTIRHATNLHSVLGFYQVTGIIRHLGWLHQQAQPHAQPRCCCSNQVDRWNSLHECPPHLLHKSQEFQLGLQETTLVDVTQRVLEDRYDPLTLLSTVQVPQNHVKLMMPHSQQISSRLFNICLQQNNENKLLESQQTTQSSKEINQSSFFSSFFYITSDSQKYGSHTPTITSVQTNRIHLSCTKGG